MVTRTLRTVKTDEPSGYLQIQNQEGLQVHEVGEFLTIGRDTTNSITFSDDCISSRHARIERKPDGFLIRDLRSRNGTYLNGARVFEAQLSDGDRIRLGETEFSFTAQIDLPSEKT